MRHWKSPRQNRSSWDSLGSKDLERAFLTAFTGKVCFPVTTGTHSMTWGWLEGVWGPQIHLVPTLILRIRCGSCSSVPFLTMSSEPTCFNLSVVLPVLTCRCPQPGIVPESSLFSPVSHSRVYSPDCFRPCQQWRCQPPATNGACSWSRHFYLCFLSPLNPREWPRRGA